ncbi:unnamed protein product, partial [Tetraodon nigroviridis]
NNCLLSEQRWLHLAAGWRNNSRFGGSAFLCLGLLLVPDDVLENLLGETEKSALEDPEAPDVVPPSALKMKLKACPLSVLPVCTVPPGPITVPENNTADVQLVQISSGGEVTLTLTVNPDDFFYLRGNALMVKKGLDYEALSSSTLVVWVQCRRAGFRSVNESVEVLVENVNDNPPNFPQNHFILEVNELLPVNATVGLVEATDVDSQPLFYRLESATVRTSRSWFLHGRGSLLSPCQPRTNTSAWRTSTVQRSWSKASWTTTRCRRSPWFSTCRTGPWCWSRGRCSPGTGTRTGVNRSATEYCEVRTVGRREGEASASSPPSTFSSSSTLRERGQHFPDRRGHGKHNHEQSGGHRWSHHPHGSGRSPRWSLLVLVGPRWSTLVHVGPRWSSLVHVGPRWSSLVLWTLVCSGHQASQVSNRDQFAVTQVTIEVMKRSRNPPRFEKDRYEGFIYSNSVPESLILRDRSTYRPFRVRARDEDFASGLNPDVKYEVQYSSYVNVTPDGFVVLKRAVKTESFALQLRAVDATTGESGTAALSVQVIPAVATQSPSTIGYRPGDMALLGLVMAALLVLCLTVIGFLLSRLWRGNGGVDKAFECLPCLRSEQPGPAHGDSLQYTNDGFQNEADQNRGSSRRWNSTPARRSTFPLSRGRVIPTERRSRHCSSCGVHSNHVPKGSPLARRGPGDGDQAGARSGRAKPRKEGQKTVWFKESKDSSDIEVEIIPDTVGRVEEETEEELEVEMEAAVRDPAAPLRGSDGGQENEDAEQREEEEEGQAASKEEA